MHQPPSQQSRCSNCKGGKSFGEVLSSGQNRALQVPRTRSPLTSHGHVYSLGMR